MLPSCPTQHTNNELTPWVSFLRINLLTNTGYCRFCILPIIYSINLLVTKILTAKKIHKMPKYLSLIYRHSDTVSILNIYNKSDTHTELPPLPCNVNMLRTMTTGNNLHPLFYCGVVLFILFRAPT